MTTISIDRVSRWFGNLVAVNDVTLTISPGVTGLLGPNGAGKSTLIHMMGGFLAPSTGTVTLDGAPIWRNEAVYRSIGLVPEREAMYDFLTGGEFVTANARALRHFIELRASRHAETEVRKLAVQVLKIMQQEAPNLFHDYQLVPLADGTFEAVTPHRKV